MTNKYFTNNYKIRYSELDCVSCLKPSSLLQLLQDIASNNAEALGFGYSFLIKHNLAWFLLKYHIEFDIYPVGINNLEIKTESRGYNKLFAFRDFLIETDSKILGKATTTWGLIDLETKSMVNPADIFVENPNITQFQKLENDLKYNKIQTLKNIDCEKLFEIRYDDLDVNQHVNNSNYILWALETLEYNFRNTKRIKTLDMLFKKESKYGSSVLAQTQVTNNLTLHRIIDSNTKEELCVIQIEWI